MSIMKILSISDIHGDVEKIELLVNKLDQKEDFDLIIIAGDIGDLDETNKILDILSSFKKQIFYVQGNWDSYPYGTTFNKQAIHIHLNHQTVNGWCFLGYSGSEANLYRGNKSLEGSFEFFAENKGKPGFQFGTYYQYRRSIIFKEVFNYLDKNDIDVDDLVFISHDRLFKLPFTPFLYIFGHEHQHMNNYHKGIHLLNTSAISKNSDLDTDYGGVGNYCLVSLNENFKVEFNEI